MLSLPERVVLHTVREPCHPPMSPAAPLSVPPAPQSTTDLTRGCCERAEGSQGSHCFPAPLALHLPPTSLSLTVGLTYQDAGGGDAGECCVAAARC